MIQYILECIAFQLVFLVIYDLFLKRETFFQWNRLYLIGTYIISMVLPWIKIEAMKTTVPEAFQGYPEFLWNSNNAAIAATAVEETSFNISWEYTLLLGGMVLATVFFGYKLFQIFALKRKGEVHHFKDFTRIIVSNSSIAFSFFKSIFLGDKVIEKEHQSIVQHELVHIRQRHSYDLMFFELMRIVGWFNPLVYVYQRRVSELHEFIADAQVAKTNKKEQYEFLLSQVFQTQNISFINQFFKKSLIKKRIVMLTKEKSKQVLKLKYILLVPIIFGMLAYTSVEHKPDDEMDTQLIQSSEDAELIAEINKEINKEIVRIGSIEKVFFRSKETVEKNLKKTFSLTKDATRILTKREYFKEQLLMKMFFENMKPVEFGDDVLPRKTFPGIPLPSSTKYENYVHRTTSFHVLDKNLMISINQKELTIRRVEKEDKNLGPGDFIIVENVRDLTGDQIRNVNTKISQTDFSERFLFISDDENAFLITRVSDDANDGSRTFKAPNSESPNEAVQLNTEPVPFAKVDEVPIFPGCEDAENTRRCFNEKMQRHISKNFRYPEEAQKQGLQGRVAIMFTMNTEGGLSNVRVRGPHKLFENEAVRIISKLPKLEPGIHEGKEVNVAYSIPITFKLTGGLDSNIKPDSKAYDSKIDVPFAVVDEVPVFPGCEDEDNRRECFNKMLQKHISKNFNYPLEAQEKGIQGRVSIMFTIGREGAIQNVRMRGPDRLLEKEAARIIGLLPKMAPGKHKGKAVQVPFSIPITFKLSSNSDFSKIKLNLDHGANSAYIIDGVEAKKADYEAMDENNIESIFILNKKASIKKYGQSGKNGVIEIKTKKFDFGSPDLDIIKLGVKNGPDPVYFVDGKESSKEKVSTIDPDDIESMSVLKGESAKTVYGEKGKNGVIQITTKKKD